MLARIATFAIDGIDPRHVSVEVDIRSGLPTFTIVSCITAVLAVGAKPVLVDSDPELSRVRTARSPASRRFPKTSQT